MWTRVVLTTTNNSAVAPCIELYLNLMSGKNANKRAPVLRFSVKYELSERERLASKMSTEHVNVLVAKERVTTG